MKEDYNKFVFSKEKYQIIGHRSPKREGNKLFLLPREKVRMRGITKVC